MSQQLADYLTAFHDLEIAMTEHLLATLRLSDEHSSALSANEAHDAVVLKARKLTEAAEALPMDRKPKGWDQ